VRAAKKWAQHDVRAGENAGVDAPVCDGVGTSDWLRVRACARARLVGATEVHRLPPAMGSTGRLANGAVGGRRPSECR